MFSREEKKEEKIVNWARGGGILTVEKEREGERER